MRAADAARAGVRRAGVAGTAGSAAGAVQRLGVLLQAGVSPVAAWRAVASVAGMPALVRSVADRVRSAHEIPAVLAAEVHTERSWAPVCAAWSVAAHSGAPLGPTLARLAEVIRQGERADAQVRTALSGPLATARILVVLPVAGLLLGLVLGFDTARILATTPPGWACLAIGGVLLAAAAGWMRALLRAARRREPGPGLLADLTAIALSGGLGPDAALALALASLETSGLVSSDDVGGTLAFARAAGVPASALLRAEADDARHRVAEDAERRAAALAVRLMLPLGVCILPSFVVLGVVPILLSLLATLRIG